MDQRMASFAHYDSEIVGFVIMQKGYMSRKVSLTPVKEKAWITVEHLLFYVLWVAVFRAAIKGKSPVACFCHGRDRFQHMLLPILARNIEFQVENPTCHSVIMRL